MLIWKVEKGLIKFCDSFWRS